MKTNQQAPTRLRLATVLQALLVTFLWSTSWVLIKIGLDDIPALTFAGLRYVLAFVVLLPWFVRIPGVRGALGSLDRRSWIGLIALGLFLYTATQGAQFLALDHLPAVTVSLILSFTPAVVALLGIRLLREAPTLLQWLGVLLFLIGAATYFWPALIPTGQTFGLIVATFGLLANAASALLGRAVNRQGTLSPIAVTVVTMGIGAFALLGLGLIVQGMPRLGLESWLIIGWLAIVNTAFAFTLWNHTLRRLTATESSVINNTMLIQIAVLAWFFLDERLDGLEILGLVLAALGALLVQLGGLTIAARFRSRRSGLEKRGPVAGDRITR